MNKRLKATACATILAVGLSSLGTTVQAGSAFTPAVAGGAAGAVAGQGLVQTVDHRDGWRGDRRHKKYYKKYYKRKYKNKYKRKYHKKMRRHGYYHHRHRRHDHDNNAGVALGAAGLILGLGALAATTSQPRRAPARPSYRYGSPEPWTRDWYAYCSSKYRSFEPDTGYYTTYSGYKRFCR
ncbi:BA14K family protein [Kaustia mangrovi]|nr:BA14K family protein [Kaustia mangrovi]